MSQTPCMLCCIHGALFRERRQNGVILQKNPLGAVFAID